MKKRLPVLFLFLFSLFAQSTTAQNIWVEDFNDLSDGTTSDAGSTAWTRDVSACDLSSGHFEVQSNFLEANDTDGEAVWTSEWIDISGYTAVKISFTLSGQGTLDAGGGNADYFRAYYKVDGGGENNFVNQGGAVSNPNPVTCPSISGDSIQLIVRTYTTGADEFYRMDDMTLLAETGPTPSAATLYAIASNNWNNTNTWSTSSGGPSCGCTPTATSDVRIGCGYTVNMNVDGAAKNVVVSPGAALEWTSNNVELEINNGGSIIVNSGGHILESGYNNSQIEFVDATTTSIEIYDVVTGLEVDDIEIAANTTLTISGSGRLYLNDDFDINTQATVTNNLTGTFTISDDLFFDADDITFTNNGPLTISSKLDINLADDVTITNNSTLSIDSDFDCNNSDDFSFTNAADATITVGDDVEFSNNSNRAVFNNYGTFTLDDDLKESPTGSDAATFYNFADATFTLGHNSSEMDWELYASYAGNTVNYNHTGNQDYIFDPQDSYFNLTLSGSNRKRSINNLDIDGDLTIAGTAQLDTDNGNDSINLAGDWIVTSTHSDPYDEGNGIEAVTFDGTTDQTISTVASDETFHNLRVNKTGGELTLNDPIIVQGGGSLTLTQGIVNTTSMNYLMVKVGATSTEGNSLSFIDGPIVVTGTADFKFPTGDDTVWAPIEITNITGFGGGTQFTAQFFLSASPNLTNLAIDVDHVSLLEYWTVEPNSGSGNADITLFWEDAGRSEIEDLGDLIVSQYNTGTSEWENKAGTTGMGSTAGPGGTGNITAATGNFGGFSFASAGGLNPLPVELVSFNAVYNRENVDLVWETASEVNNDYFEVERSLDGRNFKSLFTIAGAGNSSTTIRYREVDKKPAFGISYYRLKQVDFDGTTTYSDMVAVEIDGAPTAAPIGREVTIYPNPTAEGHSVYMKLNGVPAQEEVLVVVTDIFGRLKYSKVIITYDDGEPIVALDPGNNLDPGTYIITGSSENALFSKKLIIR